MEEEANSIELRSEEVQELMGQIPSWILRWGITVVAVILVGLVVGSCLFKYPDTLTAELTITTVTPPVEMYARETGKLETVKVSNNEHVLANDVLAVVESTADYCDVLSLDSILSQWESKKIGDQQLYQIIINQHLSLGDLQPDYATFVNALNNHLHYQQTNYYPHKIDLKNRQSQQRGKLEYDKHREASLHRNQSVIARKIFLRDSLLYVKKLISEEEYNNAEQAYLQSKQTEVNDAGTMTQLEMEKLQDHETMLDLVQQHWAEQSEVSLSLSSSTERLENSIRLYEKTYIIKSPISGKVNMMGRWEKNLVVNTGDLVMMVIPDGRPVALGRAKLPAAGAGKVRVGQPVKARLTNFPDDEYGYVSGVVTAISAIPDKDSNYYLEISFPQGLSTNYGKVLPVAKELLGNAEIIVNDKHLIENFIQPIEKLLRE